MKYLKLFEHFSYTEIEFVCANSEHNSRTTVENQYKLYNALKKDKYLLPYIQDWSEGESIQKSLAVILLDNDKSKINSIRKLAKKFNIEIDIITDVDTSKVDDVIRGELENLEINESIFDDEDEAMLWLGDDFPEDHGMSEEDIYDNVSDFTYEYKFNYSKKKELEIYRQIEVPSLNHIDMNNIGIFWSFDKSGVGTYDAGVVNDFNRNWGDRKDNKKITITAIVNINSVNWEGTLVSRAIYGDEQSECQLKYGENVIITHIDNKKLKTPLEAKS